MKNTGFFDSRKSIGNYFMWRKKRSRPAVDRVNNIMKLKGKEILEVGCGYGALSFVLADYGANVTAVEVDKNKVRYAKENLKHQKNIKIGIVQNEILPFKDNSFDGIFLFDVIEHIDKPEITIEECYRVLKKSGILYVEFTPYYSITGHHLYDFAKWPIHILPKTFIKNYIYSKPAKGFITHDEFWQLFESLNKLTITRFQKTVRKFKEIKTRYIVKYPEIFELNFSFLRYLGPFKDFFTMSFEGIYRK